MTSALNWPSSLHSGTLKKVKHHYLESIGKYSLAMISEEEWQACMSVVASNNISESVHASSTHFLKMYRTICLDSAAAEGFGRDYDALVHHKSQRGQKTNFNLPERF
jgi:hypothetical protein